MAMSFKAFSITKIKVILFWNVNIFFVIFQDEILDKDSVRAHSMLSSSVNEKKPTKKSDPTVGSGQLWGTSGKFPLNPPSALPLPNLGNFGRILNI